MSAADPRLTPARADLAAAHLRGQVEAARFVEPVDRMVTAPCAPIRRTPDPDGAMDDQALFGERFAVLEETGGWAWGWSRSDGYVGWVDAAHLGAPGPAPTHRVSALRTYVYERPDLKSPPRLLLSMNAKIAAGAGEGRFVEARGAGWVFAQHLAPLSTPEPDFVAVAERFLHAPYLWGGKESLGLDCSGLVQMALEATGTACPRDTDQQEAALVAQWGGADPAGPRQRGDVVFWRGHVGIMIDGAMLLHANAHHMAVAIEPLAEAEARIAPVEGPLRTLARRS